MGYTTRNGGLIQDFWPDDTNDTFYVPGECSLADILERVNRKWPDVDPECISITGEKIHTKCLTYDLYDPSDYTDFIVVERIDD